ncbi:unnamed protein product [Cercopithifilaria johnstoni]|uniref:C2H2-type domain-containing protein n=1 Tax=Cercopithifilaria johnstoni TaxID=2874296 RepID=A0A8J2LWI5_9BILA|nr:unnamed protein product [Cercopithifilaria johnstoni]
MAHIISFSFLLFIVLSSVISAPTKNFTAFNPIDDGIPKTYHYPSYSQEENAAANFYQLPVFSADVSNQFAVLQPNNCDNVEFSKSNDIFYISDLTPLQSHTISANKDVESYKFSQPGCSMINTQNVNEHMKHISKHNEQNAYQCDWPHCGKSFSNSKDLSKHSEEHSLKLQCKDCDALFTHPRSLIRHKNRTCPFDCRRGYKCLFPEYAAGMMRNVEDSTKNRSPDCEKEFESLSDYCAHYITHRPQCRNCGKYLKTLKALEYHVKNSCKRCPTTKRSPKFGHASFDAGNDDSSGQSSVVQHNQSYIGHHSANLDIFDNFNLALSDTDIEMCNREWENSDKRGYKCLFPEYATGMMENMEETTTNRNPDCEENFESLSDYCAHYLTIRSQCKECGKHLKTLKTLKYRVRNFCKRCRQANKDSKFGHASSDTRDDGSGPSSVIQQYQLSSGDLSANYDIRQLRFGSISCTNFDIFDFALSDADIGMYNREWENNGLREENSMFEHASFDTRKDDSSGQSSVIQQDQSYSEDLSANFDIFDNFDLAQSDADSQTTPCYPFLFGVLVYLKNSFSNFDIFDSFDLALSDADIEMYNREWENNFDIFDIFDLALSNEDIEMYNHEWENNGELQRICKKLFSDFAPHLP